MWDYDWLGYGLLLRFGGGRSVFLQGEEASELYDELEACEDSETLALVMSAYEDIAEEEVCDE
jgi:hypothetical protein